MLTNLHAQNFKSWSDTGPLHLAPLTGFFGTNSSGKTSLLQMLLMIKQTVESTDRNRVLHTGDDRSLVDLGTFYDLIHHHDGETALDIGIDWKLPETLVIDDPQRQSTSRQNALFRVNQLGFHTSIAEFNSLLEVQEFAYQFGDNRFGMTKRARDSKKSEGTKNKSSKVRYDLIHDGFEVKRSPGRVWPLPRPVKCYGFPDEASAYYQNTGFLSAFALAFEELFSSIHYLGPLREYPHRSYVWAGERPSDVGRRGEYAVPALLAARAEGMRFGRQGNKRKIYVPIETRILEWLKTMGLVADFQLNPIAENRKDYELRVRSSPKGAEVLITDVGFGVSQILPVLVLCYYVPEGSTIILEQPEIHLHPSVQADLADVLIEVVKERRVQVIVESHSEHLLLRLQRRIAEEKLDADDTALYFCQRDDRGLSHAQKLEIDLFGNINNWPKGFFGDDMGELAARTDAMMRRQIAASVQSTNGAPVEVAA